MAAAVFIYPPFQVTVDTGALATAAKQDEQTAILTTIDADTGNIATSASSIDTKLSSQATAANQATQITSLSSIDTKLSSQATATKQDTGNTSLSSIDTKLSSQATASKQDTGNTSLSSIDGKLPSLGTHVTAASVAVNIASDQTVPVSGPLTDAQLRASAVPVSAAALPLPSGASTSALQTTGNTSLSNIDGKLGSLGQKAMSGSAPVVLASDQSAIPVSQSGTWNVNNVAGTVSLPTGAATSAKQDTGNTSLSSIDGKLGSLGQKAMTGSAPVVIASDQSAIPASQSGTWNVTNVSGTVSLPTGAATSALQTTGNTSLSNLETSLTLDVVDQNDTPLFDTSSVNITASSGNPVTVVASLAANVKKIVTVEDIGSFIGLYTGAALSEVLKAVLPLGGGEIQLEIASGTRISLRAMENTAISSGKIAINFLG